MKFLNACLKKTISQLGMVALVLAAGMGLTQDGYAANWEQIEKEAQGQTVYWNAWGGGETYNNYISWVAERVKAEYGINLEHVKIADTADAVRRVLAEKTAGRDADGSIDLIWINGENFRSMKESKLLFGPFTKNLPNFRLVDPNEKPATILDFTLPTDGYESPWGMAQLVFIYDQGRLTQPPKSMAEILAYAKANPGRITYP
ncbi:MAG: ABC transporter substrate-binding protein, partial [Alphaproteobacteria bacterium]|nr:ABC transporter substrate-binding protein [Alphaproteobacteria bacterium]